MIETDRLGTMNSLQYQVLNSSNVDARNGTSKKAISRPMRVVAKGGWKTVYL